MSEEQTEYVVEGKVEPSAEMVVAARQPVENALEAKLAGLTGHANIVHRYILHVSGGTGTRLTADAERLRDEADTLVALFDDLSPADHEVRASLGQVFWLTVRLASVVGVSLRDVMIQALVANGGEGDFDTFDAMMLQLTSEGDTHPSQKLTPSEILEQWFADANEGRE